MQYTMLCNTALNGIYYWHLDDKNLKFMETHVLSLDKQKLQGTQFTCSGQADVLRNSCDGDRWQEEVVESNSAVGATLVRYDHCLRK